jgi:hypothetical protein
MRTLTLIIVSLWTFSASAGGYVDTLSTIAAGGGGGGCSGDHCAPGTEALTYDGDTDLAKADTGAAIGSGHVSCVYYRITGALDTNYHVIQSLYNNGTERYSLWPAATGAWTIASPGVFHGGTTPGSNYTGQTTNIYAACVLLADGSGETGGTRWWVFEETSADTWTERADITRTDTLTSTTDAEWIIGNGQASVAPNPVEILYAWVINADFGITYTDAAAQTEIEKYLGCSIDPAGSNVKHSWPMVSTSTSSEPDLVPGGTALTLTSITRTNRSAIWTAGGSGEAALCDL